MSKKNTSIKNSLWRSYILIIFIMLIPILYALTVSHLHSTWYAEVIDNVSKATSLSQIVKQDITDEVWSIISGQKDFTQGEQYILLRKIRNGINEIQLTANDESKKVLDVAERTETTLRYYIDKLEFQLQSNATVAENEAILEDIRGISSLMYDIFQDFIVVEVEAASSSNAKIQHSLTLLTWLLLAICALILAIALRTSYSVSKQIGSSINDMSELSSRIANGDLTARAHSPQVNELNPLAENLNTMAGRLKSLIEQNILEQQNLQKAEMKALQAQITPHFLYNTFDSIIWLAEAGEIEDVVSVTKAFSQFFRISLSRGHEWITVAQELEHVQSYLTIQKIRYANILDYKIESDATISEYSVLKLLLQPLVENAIYHGIKNKRGRGQIVITANKNEQANQLIFTVSDNGIGFTEERLLEVTNEISNENNAESLSSSYGLYNVNKRLKLYYDENASLKIESERGKGTKITCELPITQFGEKIDV